MRDEALEQLVLDTVKQYIRDVVDLDDILAMTDTAPLRAAEAQKVQRQLDKKRSEHERIQKLLMSLYESLADGIIDRDEYARLKQNYAGRCAECRKADGNLAGDHHADQRARRRTPGVDGAVSGAFEHYGIGAQHRRGADRPHPYL